MDINRMSTIARLVDVRYPTNRALAILMGLTLIVGTAVKLYSGGTVGQSLIWGLVAVLSVFFSWALSRELDPDHDLSAFVAVGLMSAALLYSNAPGILALLLMLFLSRILNRSVGPPAKINDSLLVLGIAVWLTWQGSWIFGIATAIVFLLDGILLLSHRLHRYFAAAMLIFFIIIMVGLLTEMPTRGDLSEYILWKILITVMLFIPVIIASANIKAVSDLNKHPLNARRVQIAQAMVLLTALAIALYGGDAGVMFLLPLWSAMLGVSLHRVFVVVRDRISPVVSSEYQAK